MNRFAIGMALICAVSGAAAQSDGRTYTPGSFNRLEIDGAARITLTQGDLDQVFVRGDKDVQSGVDVSLDGSVLTVHSADSWKFWRSSQRLQVEVQMRNIKSIELAGASDLQTGGTIRSDRLDLSISGAGNVRAGDLDVGDLRLDISGAGDSDLAGRAGKLSLSISGTGKVRAAALKTARASVSISGAGGAQLWVTDALNVDISGFGDVEYWGNPPEVKRSTSGFGSIKARGEKR